MVVKDEWVQAAIADDSMVVEFLVRLKQAQAAPSPAKSALKWEIRQRRSRPMLLWCDVKRDGDLNVSARDSPTTPLCWSGGSSDASPSVADGFEETSIHVLPSPPDAPSRSKVPSKGLHVKLQHVSRCVGGTGMQVSPLD